MNFSEPGCAATFAPTIESSTPLQLARALMLSNAYPINISDFIHYLATIRDETYLLLLPRTNRAERAFHLAETIRLSEGPLGDAIPTPSTLFLLEEAVNDDDAETPAANAKTFTSRPIACCWLWRPSRNVT